MNKTNTLIAAALLLIATVSQAAEVVGKVGYMSGSLMAKRVDGTVKIMGTKAEVLEGDVLGTAKDSYAQIQMNDGSKMTLRPNSNLKIVEYQFNRQEPQSDKAVFDLIKGGLRSVTGLIGKRGDPDAYRVKTKVATVGIRGTDFSARLCETENCQDNVAAPPAKLSAKAQATPLQTALGMVKSLSVWKMLALPLKAMMTSAVADNPPAVSSAGLYVLVHSGQIIVAQPTGNTLNLGRGETGFANQAALIKLPAPPAFMNADTKQTNAIEAKAAKAEEKAGNKADDGKTNKSDKEKDSGKPDEEKKDGKSEKEKAESKPDEEKKDSKSDKEKEGSKPDQEKDTGKQNGEKTDGKPDEGKADSKPDAGKADSKLDEIKNSVSPEEVNADSANPSLNKSGCVVR